MKKQNKLKQIKKRIRKRTLFFLVIALIANSFAWFIYTNKVSNSITTGVRSWKITFDQDGQDLEENVEFNFDDIYPGINTQVKQIDITNNGEMTAYISYQIESIQIFDETYTKEVVIDDFLQGTKKAPIVEALTVCFFPLSHKSSLCH